jgi:hypothetical protein
VDECEFNLTEKHAIIRWEAPEPEVPEPIGLGLDTHCAKVTLAFASKSTLDTAKEFCVPVLKEFQPVAGFIKISECVFRDEDDDNPELDKFRTHYEIVVNHDYLASKDEADKWQHQVISKLINVLRKHDFSIGITGPARSEMTKTFEAIVA